MSAVVWAWSAIPTLWHERGIIDVSRAIIAGQSFKPTVLAAVDNPDVDEGRLRASTLSNLAIIRLRRAEDALRAGIPDRISPALDAAARTIEAALAQNPSDSFLWLARFWLANTRSGFSSGNLAYLRMSYELGKYEGWISVKRNRFALVSYSALPSDLAEMAINEFVNLVRWDFGAEAAAIAAGPGAPLLSILLPRLKDLPHERRRRFSAQLYQAGLNDVTVPGIDPPKPDIPMPVLPPGIGECKAC